MEGLLPPIPVIKAVVTHITPPNLCHVVWNREAPIVGTECDVFAFGVQSNSAQKDQVRSQILINVAI